ncbi:MAG: aminotransferase class IV [Armatimonadetes bacterium]|nr:aminotransferase class IV [Armatimonadota bacterium]
MLVNLNGQLLRQEEAVVSLFDRGFQFGDGLFETMRSYGGRVYLLSRHLERLRAGAELLGIRLPEDSELAKRIAETIAANNLPDCAVRLTVTRGVSENVFDIRPDAEPTIAIQLRPLLHSGDQPEAIITVAADPNVGGGGMIKSLNYLRSVQAVRKIREAGVREGVMVREDGVVLEGSVSNIFMVNSGRVITPPIGLGILPGITRQRVIELAQELSIPTEERPFTIAELLRADEIFYTNSVRGIVRVGSVDGVSLGKSLIAPAIASKYQADVFFRNH